MDVEEKVSGLWRWKVGELARRAGLTVRALHHYEEIGLLAPSGRTESGHRLYGEGEVLRLQQVASLRSLGLSLEDIRACLDGEEVSPEQVIELHIARLRERIELEQRLCDRLQAVSCHLSGRGRTSTEELVEAAMEVTRMSERIEKYYSPEQLRKIEERRRAVGERKIQEIAEQWPALFEAVRLEMERGTDPSDESVRTLAARWMELLEVMTAGDPEIHRSMSEVWREEDAASSLDKDLRLQLMDYISKANALASASANTSLEAEE